MTVDAILGPEAEERIDKLVQVFKERHGKLATFHGQIESVIKGSNDLLNRIHSVRSRIKDPEHLRHKLRRKWSRAKEEKRDLDLTEENLFVKVTDLVGFRLLHLHTRQFSEIHNVIMDLLKEYRLDLVEDPFARTWDDESRRYFSGLGLKTPTEKPTLYTSVHYVFKSNSKVELTAELQVRTLAEELWGEVDHTWNYPDESTEVAITEQIAALARATSGCSRLVDSIFATGHSIQKRVAVVASIVNDSSALLSVSEQKK